MCDTEWGGLQPQQSQNNVVLASPDPNFPKFGPIWDELGTKWYVNIVF